MSAHGVTLLGEARRYQRTSFGLVLEDAPPVVVNDPEFVLGRSVALLSVNEEPSHRCGIVATVMDTLPQLRQTSAPPRLARRAA